MPSDIPITGNGEPASITFDRRKDFPPQPCSFVTEGENLQMIVTPNIDQPSLPPIKLGKRWKMTIEQV